MRDANRIKPYCDTLASIWNMVPDWRLGQLMINACAMYKNMHGNDPFYVEDEDFLTFLSDFIKETIA